MATKLTLLGCALLAWGGVAAVSSLALPDTRFVLPLVLAAMLAGTGGLVLSIIGAAGYERY